MGSFSRKMSPSNICCFVHLSARVLSLCGSVTLLLVQNFSARDSMTRSVRSDSRLQLVFKNVKRQKSISGHTRLLGVGLVWV